MASNTIVSICLVFCALAISSHAARLQKRNSLLSASAQAQKLASNSELSASEKATKLAAFYKEHGPEFEAKVQKDTQDQLVSSSKPSEQEVAGPDGRSSCAHGDEEFEYFDGCKQVHANGLTFDCRFGPGDKGNVMLLHGFPEWSSMYVNLMRALSKAGYQSVACNQRGYSPGASPDKEEDYNYNLLRDDVFAVASAVGFEKFHLVAHDHGAVLGWWSAGSDRGAERILTFTGMSIPHPDAFSAGLFGPKADLDQQAASQYFSMFTLPDSAYFLMYFWTNILGRPSGFWSAAQFQKALWWYNGAMAAGALAGPPVMNSTYLSELGYSSMSWLRYLHGEEGPKDLPKEGKAASSPTGPISMPAMYVCGNLDSAILCNKPFAMETEKYVPKGQYKYLEVECGHDPMNCAYFSSVETNKVINGIVEFIQEQDRSEMSLDDMAALEDVQEEESSSD